MKLIALDPGDQWTGIAISDAQQFFARPLTTVATNELESYLRTLLLSEKIEAIIFGLPKTMKGTISQQTEKALATHKHLIEIFPQLSIITWDERLSSKRAAELGKQLTREQKLKGHAQAAAFILQSYLDYLAFQRQTNNNLHSD